MEKLELKEGAMWLNDTMKNVLQEVYDHYRSVVCTNDYLRKENERLKGEAYKDEELTKMKSDYDRMKSDYYRGFPISEKENKKINEWVEKQMEKTPGIGGASGGRFTYQFTPTGLGTSGTIIDGFTGDKFTFQEIG